MCVSSAHVQEGPAQPGWEQEAIGAAILLFTLFKPCPSQGAQVWGGKALLQISQEVRKRGASYLFDERDKGCL